MLLSSVCLAESLSCCICAVLCKVASHQLAMRLEELAGLTEAVRIATLAEWSDMVSCCAVALPCWNDN